MWCTSGLILLLPIEIPHSTQYLTFKDDLTGSNWIDTDTGSLVHSLLMLGLELGSYPFTSFRYSVISGDLYSAQDRVRNSVGGPKSLIMQ